MQKKHKKYYKKKYGVSLLVVWILTSLLMQRKIKKRDIGFVMKTPSRLNEQCDKIQHLDSEIIKLMFRKDLIKYKKTDSKEITLTPKGFEIACDRIQKVKGKVYDPT